MSSEFINSLTKQSLSINNMTTNGTGVLTRDENSFAKYSYVPIENTTYTPDAQAGYQSQSIPRTYKKLSNSNSFMPDIQNDGIVKNVVMYEFGIDNINVGYSTSYETCGYVSDEINIGNCSYIQLEVQATDGDTSLEYYIIDGVNETPILPLNETEIINEKIFQNLPTRFAVDTSKTITIKKNNEETSLTLDNIEKNMVLDVSDVYTINYTTKYESNKFFPTEKKIQVKIIHREYSFSVCPRIIKSIIIKKYGGDLPWRIQA